MNSDVFCISWDYKSYNKISNLAGKHQANSNQFMLFLTIFLKSIKAEGPAQGAAMGSLTKR